MFWHSFGTLRISADFAENANAPAEGERANVEAIRAARRRRLAADVVEPIPCSPGSFAGCRTIADQILRARALRMEREGTHRE
jgi:hypothetical protein